MTENSKPTETRKTWQKPELRTVSSARYTRGGPGNIDDQDDVWYSVS
jgi:hypothetical protein